MAELERSATPLSRTQAAQGIVGAYQAITGGLPSRNLAELLLAQVWLETAQGGSVILHNWGNITGNYQGNFWRPPWYDLGPNPSVRNKYLHDEMLAGRAPRSFRAYPNHEAGARDYVSLLVRKMPSIIEAGNTGDVAAFAVAVQKSGYCPDCVPTKTEPTFRSFRDQFRRDAVFAHLPRAGGSSNLAPVVFLGLGAVALHYATRKAQRRR